MHFQFAITPTSRVRPEAATTSSEPSETTVLLQDLLDVQREILQLQRASAAALDHQSRWRAFLARWQRDFPELSDSCRQSLPHLERAYVTLVSDLTDQLAHSDGDALGNEFAVSEFLDRYGMRAGQLGAILSVVATLAEAGTTNESSS
jgi:hypothetical protein